MSFILDALKKSETDRQRQTGPALFEVKVAPPKARFPVWAVAIVALLVINMVIVGWLLLGRSSRGDETAAQSTPPAGATAPTPAPSAGTWSPSATIPPPPASAPSNTAPNASGPPNNGMSQTMAPPPTVPVSAPERAAMTRSPAGEPTESSQPPVHLPDRDQNEPTLAGNARDPGTGTEPGGTSPDDYAPATDPGSTSLFKGHVKRGTDSGFMLYQDLALTPGADLPQLRLDLHVYAPKAQDRFALINMHKLHEGDLVQAGVKVEAITPDGVVMSHNGTKFLLPKE